jgi:hypothetical protein
MLLFDMVTEEGEERKKREKERREGREMGRRREGNCILARTSELRQR